MRPLFRMWQEEEGAKRSFRAQMLYLLLYPEIAVYNYLHNTQVSENQNCYKSRQNLQKRSIPVDASVYP